MRRLARALACMCVLIPLVAGGGFIGGCSARRDAYLEAMLSPGGFVADKLATKITGFEVPKASAGQEVLLGDCTLVIPPDWKVEAVSRQEGSPGPEYGGTFLLSMAASSGAGRIQTRVFYREEESWLRFPPAGMLEALRHATPEPEHFLRQYSSDIQLLDAAYGTVPRDLAHACGTDRERVLALLVVKRHLFLPAKRLASRGCIAFVWQDEQRSRLCLDLFDRAGERRASMSVEFGSPLPVGAAEGVLWQLVGGTFFGKEREDQKRPSGGDGAGR